MPHLRITLLITLGLAAPFAITAESADDAAERLLELGARLTKNDQGVVVTIDLDSVWLADSDVSLLSAFPQLGRLSLSHTRITDLGAQRLRSLKSLQDLDLSFVQRFTDAGVASLRDMHGLRRLALRGTPVTSRILPAIAKLTELEDLDLSYTHVSDENFDELLSLSNLRRLSIGGTRVTGAVLPLLRLLPKLEELDLGGVQRVDSGLWGFALSEANTAELAKLAHLRSLDIGGATLRDTGLDRAKRTSVDRTEMVQIAKLGALVNLRTLDLSGLGASSVKPASWPPSTIRISPPSTASRGSRRPASWCSSTSQVKRWRRESPVAPFLQKSCGPCSSSSRRPWKPRTLRASCIVI